MLCYRIRICTPLVTRPSLEFLRLHASSSSLHSSDTSASRVSPDLILRRSALFPNSSSAGLQSQRRSFSQPICHVVLSFITHSPLAPPTQVIRDNRPNKAFVLHFVVSPDILSGGMYNSDLRLWCSPKVQPTSVHIPVL